LARKDQQKEDFAEIVANGRASVRVGGERADFDRPEWDGFPDWMPLFRWTKDKPLVSIRLSPKRLLALAEAVGNGSGVQLDVFGPTQSIRVIPLYGDGAKGILRPITANDEDEA